MNALGVHYGWGFSPAINLQAGLEEQPPCDGARGDTGGAEPLNILVARGCDIRHVLKTISERDRFPRRPLHFYLFDEPTEVVARNLLLLAIATDWEMPLRVRAHTWLEVFGNARVQERTSHYVARKGHELIKLVCEDEGATLQGVVDVSLLKYKHRDELEQVFKSWSEKVPFDIDALRDQRLRHHYGERYDFRKNLIDWDYQMRVRPVASIVHFVHYRHWRQTGIAFEFGDQTYTVPNRTMASYAKGRERGLTRLRRGFWMDIVTGPHMALGLDCHRPNKFATQLFDIHAKGTGAEQHRHNAVEVGVYNLLSFMFEMETGRAYRMTRAHDVYSGLGEHEGQERKAPATGTTEGAGEGAAEETKGEGADVAKGETVEGAGEGAAEETKGEGADVAKPDAAAGAAAAEGAVERAKAARRREIDARKRARHITATFSDLKLFVLTGSMEDMMGKARFGRLFHRAFLGCGAVHHLGDERVAGLFAPDALVTLETAKYVVPLKDEQKVEYLKRAHQMASKLGWESTRLLVEPGKEDAGTEWLEYHTAAE